MNSLFHTVIAPVKKTPLRFDNVMYDLATNKKFHIDYNCQFILLTATYGYDYETVKTFFFESGGSFRVGGRVRK